MWSAFLMKRSMYVCPSSLFFSPSHLFNAHQTLISSLQAGRLYLLPPYLCFLSLDRRSVRWVIPLSCIRRVERLNTRAGVFALGTSLWHGLRVVRILSHSVCCGLRNGGCDGSHSHSVADKTESCLTDG